MTSSIGWHKNQWLDIDNIFISSNDRGLKFGDGIFETILIKNNKPILYQEHFKRLENSSKILNMDLKIDTLRIKEIIDEGIKKLSLKKNQFGSVRINYSRGINRDRTLKISEIHPAKSLNNMWFEFYQIQPNLSPISVCISETEKRNQFSQISRCKTFSYNQSIQILLEANQKKFDECLLLNTNDELCCGSTFNILIKRENKWITPRKESGCLEGIMVKKALQLKIVKEELILPIFQENDVVLAINSLSCRQINKVNDIELRSNFDPNYFWKLLYN